MLISNFSNSEILKSVNLNIVFLDLLLKKGILDYLRDSVISSKITYHICACPKHLLSTSEKLL